MRRDRTTARRAARVFAALGDETRLAVLGRLSRGTPQSIARLTAGTRLSRQAVKSLVDARGYLDDVSAQWDDALARLKKFVED